MRLEPSRLKKPMKPGLEGPNPPIKKHKKNLDEPQR
jgi:hypothetical protein